MKFVAPGAFFLSTRRIALVFEGERIKSYAMITCEPNELVAQVHDCMPVLFEPEQLDHRLSGDSRS